MDPKPYLASTSWADIEKINAALSTAGGYEPSRAEGYETARQLWEKTHKQTLTFLQTADLCLECHRLAPFHYFNGNTFVPVPPASPSLPRSKKLGYEAQTVTRAALGHYIAGTIGPPRLHRHRPVRLGRVSGRAVSSAKGAKTS